MQTLKLEMDFPKMSRDEFRRVFKRELGRKIMELPYDWTSNLANVLGEIVKNFYDHANKKGVIVVNFDNHEMSFEAYDFGPGASDRPWTPVSKENCGLGISPLGMITGGLNGLKTMKGTKSCEIEITTVARFYYRVRITY